MVPPMTRAPRALAAFALVGQIGNNALAASEDADNVRTAEAEARKAMRWAPWSANAIAFSSLMSAIVPHAFS